MWLLSEVKQNVQHAHVLKMAVPTLMDFEFINSRVCKNYSFFLEDVIFPFLTPYLSTPYISFLPVPCDPAVRDLT